MHKLTRSRNEFKITFILSSSLCAIRLIGYKNGFSRPELASSSPSTKVLEKNDAGDHFPLYAICVGFEILTMIISKDLNILEAFNATNQASTLQFMENTHIEGLCFKVWYLT